MLNATQQFQQLSFINPTYRQLPLPNLTVLHLTKNTIKYFLMPILVCKKLMQLSPKNGKQPLIFSKLKAYYQLLLSSQQNIKTSLIRIDINAPRHNSEITDHQRRG